MLYCAVFVFVYFYAVCGIEWVRCGAVQCSAVKELARVVTSRAEETANDKAETCRGGEALDKVTGSCLFKSWEIYLEQPPSCFPISPLPA